MQQNAKHSKSRQDHQGLQARQIYQVNPTSTPCMFSLRLLAVFNQKIQPPLKGGKGNIEEHLVESHIPHFKHLLMWEYDIASFKDLEFKADYNDHCFKDL